MILADSLFQAGGFAVQQEHWPDNVAMQRWMEGLEKNPGIREYVGGAEKVIDR